MFCLLLALLFCQIGGLNFDYQKAYKEVTSQGKAQVVPAQAGHSTAGLHWTPTHFCNFIQPSFEGFEILASYSESDFRCNDSAGSCLPVALPVRQPQRETGNSLSHLRSTLEQRNAAFEHAKTEQLQPIPSSAMGAAEGVQASTEMDARSSIWRRWTMDQISTETGLETQIQFQQNETRKGQRQRQADWHPSSCQSCRWSRGSASSGSSSCDAHLSGSAVVDGTSPAIARRELAVGSQCSRCQCCCLGSRSQAPSNVCTAREAPRWAASGHPERNQGCQVEGGRSRHQIPSQAGQRTGKGKDGIAECQCSSAQFALIMEVIPGRAGRKMASVLSAVPDSRSHFGRPGHSCESSTGYSALQFGCVQVASPEDRPVGTAGHSNSERRGGIQRVQGSGKFQCPEDHRQSSAFGGKLEDAQRKRRRADDRRAAGHKTAETRSSRRCRWVGFRSACCAVFSLGRISMTPEYAVQWPQRSGLLPDAHMVVQKWNHQIVAESDFCSEWDAAHRATELALQFGFPHFIRQGLTLVAVGSLRDMLLFRFAMMLRFS